MGEIRRIGVVGLGAMGGGIAQLALEAGYDTVGREVKDELARPRRQDRRISSRARSRRASSSRRIATRPSRA